MTSLVVAGTSVRLLAQAAAADGYGVVALDLFGDADTRRASEHWCSIGAPGALRIEPARVLEALQQFAQRQGGDVIGWIPGSGFEGQPELLDAGARILTMIGTPAEGVRRLRDPATFFATLDAHGIAHPDVRLTAPADPQGWLLKDAHGSGGWHIRRSGAARGDGAGRDALYHQREMPGLPMSATFIADGAQAMVLGFNELLVRPLGVRPHVYAGCVGPVAVSPELARCVGEAVRRLTAVFGLRGWCSLDFIRDGDAIGVLEINPRPPASLSLYAQPGLIDAQLRACLQRRLPPAGAFTTPHIAGDEIVYARRAFTLSPIAARHLASRGDVHDLPVTGARFAAGDPVCSLRAAGESAEQVKALLAASRDTLTRTLETLS